MDPVVGELCNQRCPLRYFKFIKSDSSHLLTFATDLQKTYKTGCVKVSVCIRLRRLNNLSFVILDEAII